MVDMTRRGFLVGISAAGALIAAGVPVEGHAYPRLYGDGVHDDLPALQALGRGEKVLCEDDRLFVVGLDGSVHVRGGLFLISDTLDVRRWPGGSSVVGSHFVTSPDFRGEACIRVG